MGKLQLYYFELSPLSRSVLLTIKVLGLEDVEYIRVSTSAGEQFKPEYLKINPQHTVPTLIDDGEIIIDSHAILSYLATKYSNEKTKSLCPKNPLKRARLDHRLHFNDSQLFIRLFGMFIPIFHKGATKFTEESIKAAQESLDIVEVFLKDGDYIIGNEISVADFACVSTVTALLTLLPNTPERYPRLFCWIDRLKQLPHYEEAITKNLADFVNMVNEKNWKN